MTMNSDLAIQALKALKIPAETINKFCKFVLALENKPLGQTSSQERKFYVFIETQMFYYAVEMFLAMEKEREEAERKAQEDFRRKVACERAKERKRFWELYTEEQWNPKGFCEKPLAEGLYPDLMSNSGCLYDYSSDVDVTHIYRLVAKVAEPNPLQELFRLAYDLQAEILDAKGLSRELLDLHNANVPTD
jgi:hypothetical protein